MIGLPAIAIMILLWYIGNRAQEMRAQLAAERAARQRAEAFISSHGLEHEYLTGRA